MSKRSDSDPRPEMTARSRPGESLSFWPRSSTKSLPSKVNQAFPERTLSTWFLRSTLNGCPSFKQWIEALFAPTPFLPILPIALRAACVNMPGSSFWRKPFYSIAPNIAEAASLKRSTQRFSGVDKSGSLPRCMSKLKEGRRCSPLFYCLLGRISANALYLRKRMSAPPLPSYARLLRSA